MAKTGKRRSPAELARDRRRISELYLQGWLQVDIAAEVGVSQPTVSNDLKAIQKEWVKSTLIDFNEAKAQELAKVDNLERIYHAAWQRSCEDAETATQKQKGSVTKRKDEDGKFIAEQPAEVSKTRKGQAGDPRFLVGIQWCIDKRCKIKGIEAPVKTAFTDPTGQKQAESVIIYIPDNDR